MLLDDQQLSDILNIYVRTAIAVSVVSIGIFLVADDLLRLRVQI
jgi:hypothetical protein